MTVHLLQLDCDLSEIVEFVEGIFQSSILTTEVRNMEAFRYTFMQGDEERSFFSASVPAKLLMPDQDGTEFRVDHISPGNQNGYQRPANSGRFKKYADFFLGQTNESGFIGNPIPQPIVVNAREPMICDLVENSQHFAHITLPKTLHIVDGQHRRGGIVHAIRGLQKDDTLRDFPIPLIIMNGFSREEEATLFYVINRNAVKMPTDVAYRIAFHWREVDGIQSGSVLRPWMVKAIELVDGLNSNENSLWYKKISTPGSSVRGGISQNAFVRSLDMLLRTHKFSAAPTDKLLKLLMSYWTTIRDIVPEACEGSKHYVLLKTRGLTAMHRLLPAIDDVIHSQGKTTNPTTIREVLEAVLSDGAIFWDQRDVTPTGPPRAARFGTNNTGFNMLVEYLQETKLAPLRKKEAIFADTQDESAEPETEGPVVEDDDMPPPPEMPSTTTKPA